MSSQGVHKVIGNFRSFGPRASIFHHRGCSISPSSRSQSNLIGKISLSGGAVFFQLSKLLTCSHSYSIPIHLPKATYPAILKKTINLSFRNHHDTTIAGECCTVNNLHNSYWVAGPSHLQFSIRSEIRNLNQIGRPLTQELQER
ncbi:hypothetical protein LXL04_033272 [Taraxacum kok-saghyz]